MSVVHRNPNRAAVEAFRNTLGESQFNATWSESAALSTDEAISYAARGRGESRRPGSGWTALNRTELDVARLVGKGLANKDIAERMCSDCSATAVDVQRRTGDEAGPR